MEKWKIVRLLVTIPMVLFLMYAVVKTQSQPEVYPLDREMVEVLAIGVGILFAMWFGEKILTRPRSIKKRTFRDNFKALHVHQNIALSDGNTLWIKNEDGQERYIEAQEIDFFGTMRHLTAYTEVGAAFPIVLNDPEKTDFTIVFHRYFEPTRLGRDRNKKDRDAFHLLFYDWLKKRHPPTKS